MEEKIKHLEFVQSIITRMNTNSFQIKAISITIISALAAIYASSMNIYFLYVCIAPIVLFWFLDTYYLQQERKFRGIYNDIANIENQNKVRPFEMPIQNYQKGKYYFFNVFISKTIISYYLSILLIIILIILIDLTC